MQFLNDHLNKPSYMRHAALICLLTSICLAGGAIYLASEMARDLALIYLVAAFAPKAVQSIAEVKLNKQKQ